MLKLYKIFDWIIYLWGLYFVATVFHEGWHFYECGGSFVAGLAYLDGWYYQTTWCELGRDSSELLPTTLEVLFYIVGVWVKAKA